MDYDHTFSESDSEAHFVVNLGLRTTTTITTGYGLLFADVHEYADHEEQSAKTLGGGMVLKSYIVTLSTGKVEEVSD